VTTLVDIYEAGGAEVNEDRTQVSMVAGQMQPFEIVLRVVPIAVQMQHGQKDIVTFGVLLDDETVFGEPTVLGTPMRQIYHSTEVEIPVDQVRLLKNEQ
jgi:hypothetical protein